MAGMPHYARWAGSAKARRRLPRHRIAACRAAPKDARGEASPGAARALLCDACHFCYLAGCRLAQTGQGSSPKEQPDEVIIVWWQYIAIPALLAAGIYGFAVLVRHMTQQVTRETGRRAEGMYDEFGSSRKEKDRWPI